MRAAARKTEADIVEASLASRVKLWRIETGQLAVRVADVRASCWLYGADNETTDALANLALAAEGHGWWEDFEIMPERNGLYLRLEAIAESVTSYDSERVHALLQTPSYVRALHRAEAPGAKESVLQRQSKLMLERQKVVTTRTPPLRLTAAFGEGALTRRVGNATAMVEQVHWLRAVAREHPHVDIRVLPWRSGAHRAMQGGAFNILDFSYDADPPVVHFESHTGARYLERAAELAEYRRVFTDIYGRAIPISEYRGTPQQK